MPDNTTQTNANFTPVPHEPTTSQPLAATGVTHVTISQEKIDALKIPQSWIQKDPALVRLIVETESMKDDERRYWFQLLPIMNDDQVTKLRGILEKEKSQLAEIDKKYQSEVEKLNQKHAAELQLKKSQEHKAEIRRQEEQEKAKEKAAQEDILSQIDKL